MQVWVPLQKRAGKMEDGGGGRQCLPGVEAGLGAIAEVCKMKDRGGRCQYLPVVKTGLGAIAEMSR
jgi:hypothetical protein